ncbi:MULTISPECIES: NERD domain-containing protein [unclassified Streptomyces]|uniref:NERD domain-containing protein n=1 Tax=unclassified Streptomyces TaxID=2593676 RepID=UPI002E229D8C|nr:NERD domain-containing protein [Streptomyces sp. NBC_01023]
MPELRVTPGRYQGRTRLYVTLPGGPAAAWYDRDSGQVSLVLAEYRTEVLDALAPYLSGELSIGPPPVPTPAELALLTLHPDDDLAPNRPGEALHTALAGIAVSRFRPAPRRAALNALAAQEALGAELDTLEGAGWRVLHSVPLPGGGHIGHLLIGPAGVLSVRTLNARKRTVRIADPLVAAGRGQPEPQLRWARHEAERASLALATAVRPVLGIVGAARVEPAARAEPVAGGAGGRGGPGGHGSRGGHGGPGGPGARPDEAWLLRAGGQVGVRLLRDGEVGALAGLGGVLKPADVESLYATARDRRTWLRV